MRQYLFGILLLAFSCTPAANENNTAIQGAMQTCLDDMLARWYPLSVDTVYGGFLSSFTYDFQPTDNQDKMIVTQARHTWTNAKAGLLYTTNVQFKQNAEHGFDFLRDKMWDKQYGGFYQLVDRQGNVKDMEAHKTAYGNAFGLYALSAYYEATRDEQGLQLAKDTFAWLEEHSHDSTYRGYYQHLTREGTPVVRTPAMDSHEDTGYKDQNSSIHLLEAFTALYQVWPDPLVRERLAEMLLLIRDTIVTDNGYLTLFLTYDWKPVSFRDSTESVIREHRYLDHVSFGHDVETAFLMLEASEALGIEHDAITETMAKRMVDHALDNGWDTQAGGFYDEGYYFKDRAEIAILADTKNWWAQAEGLNALLLMSHRYPDDAHRYYDKFVQLWNYVDQYLIDHQHGDWYAGGLDKQPEMKTALKGHIWKGVYHHFRALTHCLHMLSEEGT